MPTSTYIALANVTLGGSASTVTFGSIPSTYRDLVCVIDGTTQAVGDIWYRLNTDSSSSYPYVIMYGVGSGGGSSGSGSPTYGALHYNNTTSRFNVVFTVIDYSATDKHKAALSRGNQHDGFVMSYASRWPSNTAVNSLRLGTNGTNFLTGTTFSLYGIAS